MKSRKVLLALDDSEHSLAAVEAVYNKHCCLPTDEVHLVTVVQPMSVIPPDEEANAKKLLSEVSELLMQRHQVRSSRINMHVLSAVEGVSGTILAFAKSEGMDMIVVGSRGMGAVKSSLASLVGLGSVGDALVKTAHCPVLLYRPRHVKPIAQQLGTDHNPADEHSDKEGKQVCLAYDGSPVSDDALSWAIQNVLQPDDQLQIITVALTPAPPPVLIERDELLAEERAHHEAEEQVLLDAKVTVQGAIANAVAQGTPEANIVSAILYDSSVGGVLTAYFHKTVDAVAVCGSRGVGELQRVNESFMGLGSVSTHLAHTVHGILVVVR